MMIACISSWINQLDLFVSEIIGYSNIFEPGWALTLIAIGFMVFEAWWRRWFGGGNVLPKWLKWFDKRFIKHTVNCLALFSICYWVRGLCFSWSIYFTLILQFWFWAQTFGMYFDIGRGGKPVTEYDISEYNKSWFAPILNWIFKEEDRYTPYYDFCGMLIRFTTPCLFLFFIPMFNSGFILCGPWVAMVYGLGWVMRDKELLQKLGPTSFGEYLSGAFVGWMTVACEILWY